MKADIDEKGLARSAEDKQSRLKKAQLQEKAAGNENWEDFHPNMPPCEAVYLVGYLFDVGPAMSGGFGLAPLSELEILAWQINRGVELQPWEVRFIKRLSAEFIKQHLLSGKSDCPPPWIEEPEAEKKQQIARSVKALWRT